MTDRVGQRLDAYQLIRRLGAGSFGEVYLAEHVYRKDQDRVAVKVLPQLADSDLQSFLNEARSVRLKHPHIVQVRDFGIDNHVPFIVMDYAPHGTLRERHPKGTCLPLASIVTYVKQIASALQYAHDERLIHRDIKPENLLVGTQGEVLVSDFGIATIARSSRSRSLVEMAGTVAYMAPEQVQGKPDVASDQYALAIIVYEWLCGERPFNGTAMEVAVQQMVTVPAPLCEKVPDLSPEIEQVVMKALAKDPTDRFGHVQAFAVTLEQTYERYRLSSVARSTATNPIMPSNSSAPISQISEQTATIPLSSSVKPVSQTSDAIPHSLPPVSFSPERVITSLSSPYHAYSLSTKPSGSAIKVYKTRKPPSLLIFLLVISLILSLSVGGGYYFWHVQTDASQKFDQAASLISQANPNQDAVDALHKLVAAQDDLRSVQSSLLLPSLSERLVAMQRSLESKGKQAITNYNQHASILPLCHSIATTSALNMTSVGGQSPMITSVQQGQTVFSYLLAGDANLYLLNGQKSQGTKLSLGNGTVPVLLASNGQLLFVVTRRADQSNNPTSYALHVYQPQANGTLTDESNSPRPIDAKWVKSSEQPKLITVSNADIYLFFTASNASTLDILDYQIDHLADDPKHALISVSLPLISAAAFPNQQLFLLTQDGHVKSFLFSGDTSKTAALDITLPGAIERPVGVDARDFQWNTPLVVPTAQSSRDIQLPFANIAGATLLAAGSINQTMYLFVVDTSNDRILQLKYGPTNPTSNPPADSTATASAVGASPQALGGAAVASPLQYTKQYVSSSLSSVKSIMVDANRGGLSLLTQTNGNTLGLVSINLTRTC